MECLLPSRSLTLLPCEHPSCAPLIAHVQPCAHPNCAGTIATLNHSWHTRCRVRFETRLLSAVKLTQHVRTRCGSSLSTMIDIVQPSPAAGRGWHVLHTTTTCGAISAARRWLRTRRPRLTPSPCSRTGSDALVGILVGDKEEPSSKRGHGDACASAGGVRTATLASRPLREGRAPAVRVRRGRLGPVKRVLYRPRTCLGRRYTHQ